MRTSRPSRLLIVDDNEMNRDMLARRLLRKGYVVVLAENAKELLERVKKDAVDLVYTRSTASFLTRSSNSFAFSASTTTYPLRNSRRASMSRFISLSSTISNRLGREVLMIFSPSASCRFFRSAARIQRVSYRNHRNLLQTLFRGRLPARAQSKQ